MILGAGWAFLGLVVVGLAMLVLVPGCGLVVVNESSAGEVDLAAPALVEADPAVEARTAPVATMSLARVRRQARSAALRIRNAGCDRVRAGSGFALDSRLLLAGSDVVPGASALRISSRKSAARAVGASRVYRLGDLVVARVAGRLPRRGAAVTRTGRGPPRQSSAIRSRAHRACSPAWSLTPSPARRSVSAGLCCGDLRPPT